MSKNSNIAVAGLLANPNWKHFALVTLLMTMWSLNLSAALPEPPLKANAYQIPKSAQIDAFLTELAKSSRHAVIERQGHSAGGRAIYALMVSADPAFFQSGQSREEKLTVLLVGGQHGTEPSGTEALQYIARELVEGEFSHFLSNMDFILIPNANPDGRDNYRRVNQNEINLSTDYVILSQPESRTMASVLRRYRPHVVLDVHESAILKKKSLGAQGFLTDFEAQFEFANHPNVEPRLQAFTRDRFLPAIVDMVKAKGVPAGHYIGEITDINQPITHGGITPRNFRNYAGMTGALSMLVENRLDPKEGDYPTPRNIAARVDKQMRSITAFLENAKAERETILKLVAAARSEPGRPEIYLTGDYVSDPKQRHIRIPLRRRDSGKLVQRKFEYRPRIKADDPLVLPAGYLVTKHHKRISELLDRHGVQYAFVKQPKRRKAVIQKIESLKRIPKRKGGFKLQIGVSEHTQEVQPEAGDLLINLDSVNGRLVPLLLDPRSSTGIFQAPNFGELLSEGEDFFIVRFDRPKGEARASMR